MKLRLLDLLFAEEAIDNPYSDVQGLTLKAEFPVHIDNPLNEKSPRSVLNLCGYLNNCEVVGINISCKFMLTHVSIDHVCVLRNDRLITHISSINRVHRTSHVFLINACSEFFVNFGELALISDLFWQV